MAQITLEQIKNDKEIRELIDGANSSLQKLGFTEHGIVHVSSVSHYAGKILKELGYSDRTVELVQIAGYMHDIGNSVNRVQHSISGGIMASDILRNMGMPVEEVVRITTAIGNHDEGTASIVDEITAALVIADKCDVRRSRVNCPMSEFDIHDRVNYAVNNTKLNIDKEAKVIALSMDIDTDFSTVLDFYEIFLNRILLCRTAAKKLGCKFKITINEVK